MKIFALLFAFFFASTPLIHEPEVRPEKDEIRVYVFLHESCRISQFYTPTLKELHKKYSSKSIVFEGIFPNPKTEKEDIETFQKKYELSFDMVVDDKQGLTNKLGAMVTPEVIVYNLSKEKILYKGRIDDSYFRVGKRKQVTTTSELKDVLEAIQNGEPVNVEFKDAIGCFIRKI